MKNITLLSSLLAILLLSFSACTKYDPIYGIADTKNTAQLQLKKDLVYIHDNDIYMVNEILTDKKRLTNSPSDAKTHIAFSPAHDKIAYLDASGTPIIIDTSGAVLEILTQTNVKDLKWHANNGNPTLYMLVGDAIVFHGPSLSIPSFPFDFAFPPDTIFRAIDAIEIDENLNIAFSFRYQRLFSPTSSVYKFYHGAAVNFNTGADVSKSDEDGYYDPSATSYDSITYPYYHYISFNDPNQTIMLGRITNGSESDYTAYSLARYSYSTSFISNFNSVLTFSSLYQEKSKGYTSATPYQIEKYLNVLPSGVPPPTGATNIFTLNFTNQNNSCPTYFDWQP